MSAALSEVATTVGLLTGVVALAEVARRTAVPYPTLMVVAGLAVAFVPGTPSFRLDPDLTLLALLPPILYGAAWNTSWRDFRQNLRPILLLAFGLVLATTAAVAWAAHAAIPGLPWGAAFVLGAIVSPPDAAAATAICQRLRVPSRLVTILEGESLMNDAAGLIAYRVAVAATVTGVFSPSQALLDLGAAALGGVLVGIAGGAVLVEVHRRFKDPQVAIAISLLAPYAVYLPAEALHVSGVLATVAAGLWVSHRAPLLLTAEVRLQGHAVWQLWILLLNGLAFTLIGLQLPDVTSRLGGYGLSCLVVAILVVNAATIGIRFLWIFPVAWLTRVLSKRIREQDPMPSARVLTILSWAGMRGIVSLATAMALPLTIAGGAPFPERDLILFLVFSVILATLVLQSLTLPALIRRFGLEVSPHEEEEAERCGRSALAEAARVRLEEIAARAESVPRTLVSLRAVFAARALSCAHAAEEAKRLLAGPPELGGGMHGTVGHGAAPPTPAPRAEEDDPVSEGRAHILAPEGGPGSAEAGFRMEAIRAQRRELVRMRDEGEVGYEVVRKLERELDLEEARIT